MTFREFLQTVWRRRLVAGLGFVAVLGLSALFISRQTAMYQSGATVALLPDSDKATTASFYDSIV